MHKKPTKWLDNAKNALKMIRRWKMQKKCKVKFVALKPSRYMKRIMHLESIVYGQPKKYYALCVETRALLIKYLSKISARIIVCLIDTAWTDWNFGPVLENVLFGGPLAVVHCTWGPCRGLQSVFHQNYPHPLSP